jgi:hypothetical protein
MSLPRGWLPAKDAKVDAAGASIKINKHCRNATIF